jgi:hypothetical protein
VHQRAGDCHALLLPARQRGGPVRQPIAQADAAQQVGGGAERVGRAGPLKRQRGGVVS